MYRTLHQYGGCHRSGEPTTPSKDTNSDATTFLIKRPLP
jgi:hypothetical protein